MLVSFNEKFNQLKGDVRKKRKVVHQTEKENASQNLSQGSETQTSENGDHNYVLNNVSSFLSPSSTKSIHYVDESEDILKISKFDIENKLFVTSRGGKNNYNKQLSKVN